MLTIKLKEILKERNMTMTELHKETGISKKHLSQMANHKTGGITFSTLEKIATALDMDYAEMFTFEGTIKYRYFMSAQINYHIHKFGFGHYEVESDFKITDLEGVRTIARKIEETNNLPTDSVIILNFQLFDNV